MLARRPERRRNAAASARGGASRGALAVFEPAPVLDIAVSRDGPGGTRVHLHPGGQGVWVARMAAEMGARPRLCAPAGGRSGLLLPTLIEDEGIAVDAVECHRSSAVWISTGYDGDPADIAQTPPPPLDRHEADRLYNVMLSAGLASGVAVLTGLADPGILPATVYRRLAADLSANGAVVIADVSPDVLGQAIAGGVDVLKVSHEELIAAGYAENGSRREAITAIGTLREAGARAVIVSRAEEPAIAHAGGRLLEIVPPRLEALNPRGAGDAMTGALAAAISLGVPIERALALAVAAGSLNVTRRGLGTGERASIERFARLVRATPLGTATASR